MAGGDDEPAEHEGAARADPSGRAMYPPMSGVKYTAIVYVP